MICDGQLAWRLLHIIGVRHRVALRGSCRSSALMLAVMHHLVQVLLEVLFSRCPRAEGQAGKPLRLRACARRLGLLLLLSVMLAARGCELGLSWRRCRGCGVLTQRSLPARLRAGRAGTLSGLGCPKDAPEGLFAGSCCLGAIVCQMPSCLPVDEATG